MQEVSLTVVIPTLNAGDTLAACVRSLQTQTRNDFEVIIVDNSGKGLVRKLDLPVRVIENERNVGFGSAINQGIRASTAPFIATLNDDAAARPEWADALLKAVAGRPDVGMCASRVLLTPGTKLDSAGMLIARDGTSKQRGHLGKPCQFEQEQEVLFPSGSAALYRRAMLDEVGLFDDDLFLYCEDTDIGLRARWAGWRCIYVPGAIVEHHYSLSAGRVSALKAYLVERNRIRVAAKTLPWTALLLVPFASVLRYFWHGVAILQGRGAAAEFSSEQSPVKLAWLVLKAHLSAVAALPHLLRQRAAVKRKLSTREFLGLLKAHSISLRQVAAL